MIAISHGEIRDSDTQNHSRMYFCINRMYVCINRPIRVIHKNRQIDTQNVTVPIFHDHNNYSDT